MTTELEIPGVFEVELPPPFLVGNIKASIHVKDEEDEVRIIGADDAWIIDLDWTLKGSLLRFMCGYWCVRVIVDCLCGQCYNFYPPEKVPMDGCKHVPEGKFHTAIEVPAGAIPVGDVKCSQVCKVVIVITFEDNCGVPGPFAGMVEGPLIQFYSEGPES